MDISVVVPVYGCRSALPVLCERLNNTLSSIVNEYEIILVEDHCPQGSWESIKELCENDKRIKGIHLSRNFGQANAITAGIDICTGDWVVVMDCDLQDPPEAIVDLYKKAQEGYDVVFARRIQRKDTAVTLFLSRSFYRVLSYFTEEDIDPSIGNFSVSRRSVIENYCRMREQNRAYQMFIKWLGFRQTSIDIECEERYEGRSSYNMRKKIRFAVSLITTHSNKPLKLSIKLGFILSSLAMIYILVLIIQKIMGRDILAGWTSIIAAVVIMGGLILMMLGIVGIYIGNIFNEVKNRPIYVISEVINCENRYGGDSKKCSTD